MRSEFELIQNIKDGYSLRYVGDDCAVLPQNGEMDLLMTADLLVEDIDFRLEWTTPELIGHKSLAVSLSDVAAMGGTPVWSMLSLGIPEHLWKSDFIDKFYEGWFALANEFKVELIGGDISRTPDKLVIDSVVGGEVAKGTAIVRSGAKPSDKIYVTGTLGGAAGGLELLENDARIGDIASQSLVLSQLQPQPKVVLGKLLQSQHIATSLIDLSDGLSSDLRHICDASGVGAQIIAENIPINPHLAAHFPPEKCLEMALNGGEDLELLFTTSEKISSYPDSLQFTHIGEVTANVGTIELSVGGESCRLPPKGYRHF
jgi:thiamine-monophosphate kinase